MKTCTKCKESKSFDCFSKRSLAKDGKCSQCKDCCKVTSNSWYQNNKKEKSNYSSERYKSNPEEYKARIAKWRENNLEKFKSYQAKWEQNNIDSRREYFASWHQENSERRAFNEKFRRKQNPEKFRKWHAAYRARKLKATPLWFGELDDLVMTEAYDLISLREVATGFSWNVDHMFPLKGKNVCGLHIWNNVQVIPETVNKSKSNRMIFNYSLEWLNGINKFNYEN
jgi:hypothetical protein